MGFKNVGNTCWTNAVLQSLVATPPFFNMLVEVKNKEIAHTAPTLQAFVKLISKIPFRSKQKFEEERAEDSERKTSGIGELAEKAKVITPPDHFINLLSGVGAQEDAHEFLSVLLEKLHDECKLFQKKKPKKKNGGWHEVGKNNTKTTVNYALEETSVIQNIFSSFVRHNLKKGGNKTGLKVQVQPYNTIPVDLSVITSLQKTLIFPSFFPNFQESRN